MNISNFTDKFNKIDGNIYTIEEEITLKDGKYVNFLIHDNVNLKTINVYTQPKLTGDQIQSFTTTTPSMSPWKTELTVFSDKSPLYVTYETVGDQIEADDINALQKGVIDTQTALNSEINRATTSENTLTTNLSAEITRAKGEEGKLTTNLDNEVKRATQAENTLTTNLSAEINRAKAKESQIDTELGNRYTKDKVYTKEEVLAKISELINNAPDVLDTFKEIADALGNDPNFATTMTTMLSKKVDKVDNKGLSTNDFTEDFKNMVVDTNNKKHTHENKSIIDKITQTVLDNINSAFSHISDAVKHITNDERTLWNTVSSKFDKGGGTVTGTINLNGGGEVRKTNNDNLGTILIGTDEVILRGGSRDLKITKDVFLFNDLPVYHGGNKPTANDVGASPLGHVHDDRYYKKDECDTKFATKNEVATSGGGDMSKSVYDTNNNGAVDKADKLSTGRTIQLTGDVIGSGTFDGSSNLTLNTKLSTNYMASFNNTMYMKLFTINIINNYANTPIIFEYFGRTTNTKRTTFTIKFQNINNKTPEVSVFKYWGDSIYGESCVLYKVSETGSVYEFWSKQGESYDYASILNLTYDSATTKIEFNGTVSETLPENMYKKYTTSLSTITSNISGTANKAISDSDGNDISKTYVKHQATWNSLKGV